LKTASALAGRVMPLVQRRQKGDAREQVLRLDAKRGGRVASPFCRKSYAAEQADCVFVPRPHRHWFTDGVPLKWGKAILETRRKISFTVLSFFAVTLLSLDLRIAE
jgi:hypothetical protein